MFQLTLDEAQRSRSQNVTLNGRVSADVDGPSLQSLTLKRGANINYLPCAFTEQGVAMLSSVLRSPRAVHVNIEIMHAFVRLRQMLQANAASACLSSLFSDGTAITARKKTNEPARGNRHRNLDRVFNRQIDCHLGSRTNPLNTNGHS